MLLNKVLIIFTSVFAIGLVFADDYADWDYRANITLNTTTSGADVGGNVYDYPVLVRLNPSNFDFSQSKDNCIYSVQSMSIISFNRNLKYGKNRLTKSLL
jgi:hypothetical protein